jgi:hypothetical protein
MILHRGGCHRWAAQLGVPSSCLPLSKTAATCAYRRRDPMNTDRRGMLLGPPQVCDSHLALEEL